VAELIGLDKDIMIMLLDEFFSVMEEEIAALRSAIEKDDAELIRHHAHKMKGAAANMMVEDLREHCHDLQDADKNDKKLVNDLFAKIEASYAEFRSLF
jgi:HPt (histidine-containing phosphotransfer) domain-containing protein